MSYASTLPSLKEKLSASEVAENLSGVLTASRVPFEQYDFSNHLRGQAWFWLLRGEDDRACPQRGFLKLTDSIYPVGPPELVGEMSDDLRVSLSSAEWTGFLKILGKKAERGEDLAGDETFSAVIRRILRRPNLAAAFANKWDRLEAEYRQTVCRALENLTPAAEPWFYVEGVPDAMLLRNLDRLNRPLRFDFKAQFNGEPRLLALHGVRLPAGFVEWDLMAGRSSPLSMLGGVPSGMLVDMRGDKAPTPAANRLFVLTEEARKGGLPFLRACMHHSVELAAGRAEDGWRVWLGHVLESIVLNDFGVEALKVEYDLVDPHLLYEVRKLGVRESLTRQQLVETFGEWVPLTGLFEEEDNKILVARHHAPLLVFRRRRKRADGILEVNMMSKVEVSQEKLPEEIANLDAELYSAGIDL